MLVLFSFYGQSYSQWTMWEQNPDRGNFYPVYETSLFNRDAGIKNGWYSVVYNSLWRTLLDDVDFKSLFLLTWLWNRVHLGYFQSLRMVYRCFIIS